eukprot:486966_1
MKLILNNLKNGKKNDIITVCLNCDEMTVKFKINHKEIAKPMKLKEDKTYHFVICSQTKPFEFQIVFPDTIVQKKPKENDKENKKNQPQKPNPNNDNQ